MSAWVREMRRVLLGKKDSAPPETVRCQEVKLVDAAGRTRVVLTMTLDGSPWMSFYDAAGTGRLVMGLRPDGTPFLALWDATGHPLVEFPPRSASLQDASSGQRPAEAGGDSR